MHDNFGSLPANAQELALAVRNDDVLSNFLSYIAIDQGIMLSNIH